MQPIVSGPSRERILRTLLVTCLISFFGAAFLLDGYVGYQENNVRQLVKSLGLREQTLPGIDQKVTALAAKDMMQNITPATRSSEIVESLGEPAFRHDRAWYYVGPGGHFRIDVQDDRVQEAVWVFGVHSETDIAMQRTIGWGLSGAGTLLSLFFFNVLLSRTVLNDAGLKTRGRPLVSWLEMTGLEAGGQDRLEMMTLSCTSGTKLRLARYDVAKLGEIVDAICEKKGFPHPQGPPDGEVPDDPPESTNIL